MIVSGRTTRPSHDTASCSRRGSPGKHAPCVMAQNVAPVRPSQPRLEIRTQRGAEKGELVASALIMCVVAQSASEGCDDQSKTRSAVFPDGRGWLAKISGTRSRSPNGAKRNQDALTPLSFMAVPEDHSWRHTECGFRFIRATGPPTYTASGTINCASGAIAAAVRTRPCGVRLVFPPATRSSASG